jgi:hypothetical protein
MYIQNGGNVLWNSTWKEVPGQEYSILEKNLLIKLNAIPIDDSITKHGKNKGRVKNLDKWWSNPYQTYPMTKSLAELLESIQLDDMYHIALALTEIIDRREQDKVKLQHLSSNKGHDNYLESLKNARTYVRNILSKITRKKFETHEHQRSPLKIDTKLSPDETSKLSHEDTSKLSHDADEFVPSTYYGSNLFHLHRSFDENIYVLMYHPSYGYYWLNKFTNETYLAENYN